MSNPGTFVAGGPGVGTPLLRGLSASLGKQAQVADRSAYRAGIGQRQVHPSRLDGSRPQPVVEPVGVVFPDHRYLWGDVDKVPFGAEFHLAGRNFSHGREYTIINMAFGKCRAKGLSMCAQRARQLGVQDRDIDVFVLEALFSTVTNVDFDVERLQGLLARAV